MQNAQVHAQMSASIVRSRVEAPENHFETRESPRDSAAMLSNRTVEMRDGGGKKRNGEGDGPEAGGGCVYIRL
jgi:hypothetical protein